MFGHETGVVPFVADAIIALCVLAHIGSFAQANVCSGLFLQRALNALAIAGHDDTPETSCPVSLAHH
jgi:hypothetical protein